ncbi:hypothetical protein GS415_03955 [Rhodococcus hoagii]|nr:hypothetical protein [Prescottella equi]
MSDKHWEYTGETREGHNGKEVRKIRITGPNPYGFLGGWIERDSNIGEGGLVVDGAEVVDTALVHSGAA